MELDRIVFTTDTSELTKATDAIGTLVQEMSKISAASASMAKVQAQTEAILARAASSYADARKKNAEAAEKELRSAIAADKADQQREKSTSKATEAVDKSTGATNKNSEAVSNNTTVLQRQSDILEFQAQGWSKSQAGILATAKAAKTAAGDMQELMRVLETQRKLMGTDPFDKSMSGLKSLQNQYSELKESLRQYNADTDLTMKQTKELARDKQRILEQLKVEGASFSEVRAAIRAYNAEYNALATQYNKLANAEAGVIKQRKEMVSAANYVEQAEQKMRAALDATNSSLNKAATDDLVKYENALRKSGMSQDLMTEKLATYKNQLAQVQAQEQKRAADHLARSLSPQLTDIGVSLWSGQSPLTVLIQQGGQMMDLFRMSGVEAQDLGKVIRESFNSMIPSILAVGKAMGSFVINTFYDAGKAAVGFVANITGITTGMDAVKKSAEDAGMGMSSMVIWTQRLMVGLSVLAASGVAAVVIGLASAAVAFAQTIKENDKLAVQLGLTGAAMGISFDRAMELSSGMQSIGVNTSDALRVLAAMSKQGVLTASELQTVTKAAVDLETYGGVAIEETVKSFAKMKEKPVEALLELAKNTGLVSVETVKSAMELQSQGDIAGTTAVAITELARVNSEQVERMKSSYNGFSLFMIDLGKDISNFFSNTFKDLFYASSPKEQLQKQLRAIDQTLAEWGTMDMTLVGAVQAIIPGEKERVQLQRDQILNKIRLINMEEDAYAISQKNNQAGIQMLSIEKSVNDELDKQDMRRRKKSDNLATFTDAFVDEKVKDAAKLKGIDVELIKSNDKLMDSYRQLAKAEWQSAQKKSSKSENYYAALMREATNNTIEAENAVNNLTKSEQKLLEVRADPRFASLSKIEKANVASKYEGAIAAEKQERATIALSEAEEFRVKVLGKSEGLGKQYYADIEALREHAKAAKWSTEQVDEMIRKIYEGTPVMKQYTKAIEDAEKALAKYNEESIASQADTSKENKDLDLRVSLLGKTAEQQKILQREHERSIKLSQVDLDLMKKKRDIQADIDKATKKDGLSPDSKEVKDLAQASVQAEQDAAEKRKVINRDVAVQYAEDMQKEFDRISGGITDSIVTALFEGGKAGAASLRSLIVNELKKPVTLVVQAVVNTLLGDVIGGLVGGGVTGGSAGGKLQTASNLNSLFGTVAQGLFGSSVGASTASLFGANAVGMAGGDALGALIAANGQWAGVAAGATSAAEAAVAANLALEAGAGIALETGTLATAAAEASAATAASSTSMLASIPGWGWALAGGALLLGSMDFGGEQRFGGGYQLNGNKEVKYTAGPGGGQINQEAQEAVVNETYKSVNSILKSLGSTLEVIDFYAGLETSGKGKGGTFAGGKLSSGAEFGKKWQAGMYSQDLTAEEAVKQFAGQMKIVTVEALKAATDIPMYLQDELEKVDVAKLTGDTAGLVLEETNRMYTLFSTVKGALELLNKPMFDTTTAGYALTETFVEMFGGIEGLKTSVSSYYDNFYSEAEKELNIRNQLTAALSEQNLTLPKTKDEYRNLVEAQDLTTEAGRANYAVLLKNAGAFAELTPAASAANKQITGLNKMFAGLGVNTKLAETKFDKATKEMFESLGVSVEDYSNSIADVIAGIATGKIPAEDAGAELANAAVGGITNAIAQGASQAIAAQFVNSIITPIIANIMAGNEALAGINLEAGLADLQTGATALGTVLQQIGPTIGGIAAEAAAIISGSVAGVQGATTTTSPSGYSGSVFAIGGSAVDNRFQSPALESFGNLATETMASNQKVSELLQKLLNPEKEYANRYLELADNLIDKQKEHNLEYRKQQIQNMKDSYADAQRMLGVITPIVDEIAVNFQQVASGISNKGEQFDKLAELIVEKGGYDPDSGLMFTDIARTVGFYIGETLDGETPENRVSRSLTDLYGEDPDGFMSMLKTAVGISNVTTRDITAATENLAKLEKELREWYIAQARVIAVEDYATNLEETAAAKKKTAELKRTGGLEDPVTKLKEQFAAKMQALDEGINKALRDEIDRLNKQKPDAEVMQGLDGTLTTAKSALSAVTGDQLAATIQFYEDEIAGMQEASSGIDWTDNASAIFGLNLNKQIGEYFKMLGKIKSGEAASEAQTAVDNAEQAIKDAVLAATDPAKRKELQDEIDKYEGGVTEWFEAQAELLSTEMLVDINSQIKALETEEKGPLSTIKDAIQKYINDFTELGTLTDEIQAQLDKLSGLQLSKAREELYTQLIPADEIKQINTLKLTEQFTELGKTLPASADELRKMIDAAREAGNITLADSLLELIPAFIALQDATNGVNAGVDAANKAFEVLQRATEDRIKELEKTFTATDLAMKVLEKVVDSEKKRLNEELKTAQESINTLKKIFDTLTNGIKTLRGEVQQAKGLQVQEARRVIDTANLTGVLPDADALADAVSTLTGSVQQGLYATSYDKSRAFLTLANDLEKLKSTAEPQLTSAEQTVLNLETQIKQLDSVLENARKQIDELRGIDASLYGIDEGITLVDAALQQLQTAYQAEEEARVQINTLNAQLEAFRVQIDILNGIDSSVKSVEDAVRDLQNALSNAVKPPTTPPVVSDDGDMFSGYVKSAVSDAYQSILGREADQAGLEWWTTAITTGQVSLSDLEAALDAGRIGSDIPAFASGGQYQGGLALVGEQGPELINFSNPGMVYTAAQSSGLMNGSNAELIFEIKALRSEVIMLRAEARATAINTSKSTRILDDVTQGGDSFKTTAV